MSAPGFVVPYDLAEILRVFNGRSGDDTKALYASLAALGPAGQIAVNLLRAQKNSGRAKEYRRGSSTRAAYDTKNWAVENLTRDLGVYGEALGLSWGWGLDPKQVVHSHVLYIDIPTGQVSFHCETRGAGPDYGKEWDGMKGASPGRILRWAARLFAAAIVKS